jgi:hypothetical protein
MQVEFPIESNTTPDHQALPARSEDRDNILLMVGGVGLADDKGSSMIKAADKEGSFICPENSRPVLILILLCP